MVITIDGPAASGKSTVARALAQKLGVYYLASGYLYRALAYLYLDKGLTIEELATMSAQETIGVVKLENLEYCYTPDEGIMVKYQGRDLTSLLKNKEIDRGASVLASNPVIRFLMLDYQRSLACEHDLLTEGRDCGSVVFPHADVKFFLTAAPEVRAKRWYQDQTAKGVAVTQEQALSIISERDERDINRAIAPLVIPQDCIVVDSSTMTAQEVEDYMLRIIRQKIA